MAHSDPSPTPADPPPAPTLYERIKQQFSTIPSIRGCAPAELYQVDGFYLAGISLIGTMATQQLFNARPTDVILATTPKSGTTWLKALTYAVTTRVSHHHADPEHPLRKLNPHDCVPTLEFQLYTDEHHIPDLDPLPDPRLFNTHIPYGPLLPPSVTQAGGCRIVYLCRNPKDTFVSMWHFSKDTQTPLSLDEAFEHFCNGVSFFGPFWDHALGYWNASRERPEKVMFVKYEELMEDPVAGVRRLAEFLGCRFTEEEERGGVVEGIVELCGFESLKNLEVNKSGKILGIVDNKRYFRRGKVGDWVNHLTPEMARRLDEISERKFAGTGLTL